MSLANINTRTYLYFIYTNFFAYHPGLALVYLYILRLKVLKLKGCLKDIHMMLNKAPSIISSFNKSTSPDESLPANPSHPSPTTKYPTKSFHPQNPQPQPTLTNNPKSTNPN